MRKLLLMVAVVGLMTAPALAGVLQTNITAYAEDVVLDGPRVPINLNYDNWTSPATGWVGSYQNGTSIVADDISFGIAPGAGWLQDMGLSVVNVNGPSGLKTGQGAIYFYNPDGTPIYDQPTGLYNGFGFNLPTWATPGLAIGGSSRISFAPGSLAGLGFNLPANFWCATEWWETTQWWGAAGTAANLGVQIRNGPVVGTSADIMWDVTANTTFNFGGSPVANMGYKFSTDFTPEPSTLMLLGLGLVGLLRRR